MKKILVAIAVIGLLAVSCKKDIKTGQNKFTDNTSNAKKYKVTYTFDGFSQTIKSIGLKTAGLPARSVHATPADTLAQAVTQYYYIVYNSSGNEIKRIKRYNGQPILNYYHED